MEFQRTPNADGVTLAIEKRRICVTTTVFCRSQAAKSGCPEVLQRV